MQAVTVSFDRTEQDAMQSWRHVLRHGYARWLVTWSSALVALVFAVPLLVVLSGLPMLLRILAVVGTGLLQFAFSWYALPALCARKFPGFWDYDTPSFGSMTVRFAPEAITWTAPTAAWSVPWSIVRSVETVASGICVTAGHPAVALWIPARSFPTEDDLEMTGRLAAQYASSATPVPIGEIEWPESPQQRKSGVILGVVYTGQMLLALLLYLVLK